MTVLIFHPSDEGRKKRPIQRILGPSDERFGQVLDHEKKYFFSGAGCFTICLFISPDLDGYRAPICFTICLFISPDIDTPKKALTM
jgi:hypothetical protein